MNAVIIGFGAMGQRYYKILKSLNLNIHAIFDCKTQIASIENEKINLYSPDFLSEYLLKNVPDLVIISTTANAHFHYLKICFAHKIKYVVCEKPLCISIYEAEQILSLSKENPEVKVAVNHQMRFIELYTKIKDFIVSNEIGKLCSISVQSGNIGLAMNAIHYIEVLRYLTSEYVYQVWGWLGVQLAQNPRGNSFQDYSGSLKLETKSKIRMYMDISENQGHGIFSTYTFNYGQIHIDELVGRIYINHRKQPDDYKFSSTRYALESAIKEIKVKPLEVFEPTKNVILSLLNDKNYPTLLDAIMPIRTIVAALYSSENNNIGTTIENIPQQQIQRVFNWA